MSTPKPSASRDALESQDNSIKARKSQLFEAPEASPLGVVRPFAEYLKEVPADPLSPGLRAGLWALAALVGLLFLASLMKGRMGGPAEKPGASEAPGSTGRLQPVASRTSTV